MDDKFLLIILRPKMIWSTIQENIEFSMELEKNGSNFKPLLEMEQK